MSHALKTATILALTTAGISGISNFLNKIAVTASKDPVVFTTLKNAVVAVLLIGIILAIGRWRELKTLKPRQFLLLFLIGAIGGSVPFALFFTGLTKTSALNAGLIHKTLFLWVLLIAIPLLKERVTRWQMAGIGAIFAANLLVGGFQGFKFNTGELMILAATILWAIENVIAKIALKELSSVTVACARMVLGSLFLVVFLAQTGRGVTLTSLTSTQWMWTLLTAALLLGYVSTWYAALKRAPVTYVATLLVPATLITNVLTAIFLTHTFPALQLASTVLLLLGAWLVIAFAQHEGKKQIAPAAQASL